MTTAAQIINSALRFQLNRLSPGETVDADTQALCLDALNDIVDELNHSPTMLWREVQVLSDVTTTGSSLVYGTTWTGLTPGSAVLGLNAILGGYEWPMDPITVQELQHGFGSDATRPLYYAFDGHDTLHIRGPADGHDFRIRVRESVTAFADATTSYTLADGVRSALTVMLAERVGDVLVGKVPPRVARDAMKARTRLRQRATRPDILNARNPKALALSGGSDTGGGTPGGEREFSVTYETFMLDFNEFTQYDPIPGLPSTLTSDVTGSEGSPLQFRFWGVNTALDGFDNNYFVADGDLLSTFPGLVIAARSASGDYSDHSIIVEWDMDKDLLQPEYDTIRTVQFLDKITFKYSGQVRGTIEDTGEGYDTATTYIPLVGWSQAVEKWVEDEFGNKLSNNRMTFEPDGLGVPAFTIDEVEVTIGTRTLI